MVVCGTNSFKKKGIDPDEFNPRKKKTTRQKPHSSLLAEARELLGTLKGLKLAGYTDAAVDGLRAELNGKIDELMKNPAENLELIGLYTAVIRLVEKGDFERAEELLRMF